MAKRGLGLLKHARLTRKQLIMFALMSAALNGIITASVGAWLGQTYAKYQARRQSIESLVHLVYDRRTRAGMVTSSLRRGADVDEVRFRKRAYDEAYVEWNKNVMQNIFAIREVTGDYKVSSLEKYFEDDLVAVLADIDRCVTKAYDARIANQDPMPILEKCRMPELHQFALDCGATFTNELYKLSKLTFLPFLRDPKEGKGVSEKRIVTDCKRPAPKPDPVEPVVAQPDAASSPAGVSPVDPASSAVPQPAAVAPPSETPQTPLAPPAP